MTSGDDLRYGGRYGNRYGNRDGGELSSFMEALVRGEPLPVCGFPEPPARARLVYSGELDPLDLSSTERADLFASELGPALFHRFVHHLGPFDLWNALLQLPAPPLELPTVLDQLYVQQGVGDAGLVARVCTHLESLVGGLQEAPSHMLSVSLGLPWTLGRIIDGLTMALEAGAPPPTSASATHALTVTLDRLGVSTVWSLLPAQRGALSHRLPDVPLEVLLATVEALNLLGATGTTIRLLVVLLLLSEPARIEDAHRQLLTRLLTLPSARIPKERVVQVWSLANR